MADNMEKRARRLVTFRTLQRDRASREVQTARQAKESAETHVRNSEETVRREAEAAQEISEWTRTPEDIQLALACVDAARAELSAKHQTLKNAEKHLGAKSKLLLATHKKVQQMEALKQRAAMAARTHEKKREQAEIDDLATNREARQ